jgi:hypothetical protein
MMRKVLRLVSAAALPFSFGITLGFLSEATWLLKTYVPKWNAGAVHGLLLAMKFFLDISTLLIVVYSSLFCLLLIPLTAWSVGSASWGSLDRFIFVFWLVLALFAVVSGNPNGLILLFGVGLILLWFLRNRERLVPVKIRSNDIIALVALILFTCVLSIGMLFRDESRIYFAEISAIYVVACVCQGFKIFPALITQMRIARKSNQAAEPN